MANNSSDDNARAPQHVEDHIKVIEAQVDAVAEIELDLDKVVSELKIVIEETESQTNAAETREILDKPCGDILRPGSRNLKADQAVFQLDVVEFRTESVDLTGSEHPLDMQFGPSKPMTGAYHSEGEEGGSEELMETSQDHARLLSEGELATRLGSLTRCTSGERDKLQAVKSLRQGGEARIWLLRREKDKKLLVCKVIPHGLHQFSPPAEVRILQALLPRHDRIIRLRDWFSSSMSTQLYFDYYNGGDLEQLSHEYYRESERLPESFLWHVFLQLCEAVAFMHYGYDPRRQKKRPEKWQKIIHRDIKPSNVFLRLPLNYPVEGLYPSLVLADFGMASVRNSSDRIIGTPEYQPPENPQASRKADIWAIGAIVHFLIHDLAPPIAPKPDFYDDSLQDWCCEPMARQPSPIDDNYSRGLAICVSEALRYDPSDRWNSVDLLDTILNSQQRKKCMKEQWKPLTEWAFPENSRMEAESSEHLDELYSSRAPH